MLSCMQASELLSHDQDREPTLQERLSLGFHLAMCRGCRNYRKHVAFLRAACRNHPVAVVPSGPADDM